MNAAAALALGVFGGVKAPAFTDSADSTRPFVTFICASDSHATGAGAAAFNVPSVTAPSRAIAAAVFMRGSLRVLTSRDCNSSSGQTCDWHWANFWTVEGFATGDMREPVDVQFTYEDLRSVAELSNENGAFILRIIKEASNPESVKETERLFGQAIETKGRPEPMNVNFQISKLDERLLRLGVLRAAYLAGIAVAEYRWIPVWDPIRRQILGLEHPRHEPVTARSLRTGAFSRPTRAGNDRDTC